MARPVDEGWPRARHHKGAAQRVRYLWDSTLGTELVIERDPEKNRHAEVIVVEEGLKTGLAVARANQPQLIHEKYSPSDQASVVPRTHAQSAAYVVQGQQRHRLQRPDYVAIGIAEQNGRGTHANLDVVIAVHHGIDGVVNGDPEHIGDQQQPGHARYPLELRGERHRNSPPEGDPEIHLRYRQKTLDEWVTDRQSRAGDRIQQRETVQLQHQTERRERQRGEQHQRFQWGYPTSSQRPLLGALHVRVEAAVGVIVDGAARGTHEHRADHENDEQPRVGLAAAGDPQGPQCWPQQQPNADGPVQPNELNIILDGGQDARQLIRGKRMKAYAVDEPSPARGDTLRQFNA